MVKIKKNEYYKAYILDFICNKQPISRIRIGKMTGIRLATITKIVRWLIKEGLVKETGKIRNRRGIGRKEKILEIIPEGKFFIGCELKPNGVQTLLLNLKGEIIHTELCSISPEQKSDEILINIKSIIDLLIKKTGIPYKKIYGVGFVDPGVIDVEKGISISSTIMPSWKNVPVKKYLEGELGLKVFLINTSQAKVLAEYLFGKCRGISDLIFVEYGEGIACGIISDGRPIGGYMEIAGEMGHFNFPGREEMCRCGNRGCLEAIASIPSIEKRIKKIVMDKNRHPLKDMTSIEDIMYAFERREPLTVDVINDVSDILGIAVANVVKLLNPKVVVFDSNLKRVGNKFVDMVFNSIKKNIISGEKVRLEISHIGKEQGALGGAALTLQNFLKKT